MAIQWNPTTEERFMDALEALPPAAAVGGYRAFLLGEPYDYRGDQAAFHAFKREKGGLFFASDDAVTFAEFKAEFPTAHYHYDSL